MPTFKQTKLLVYPAKELYHLVLNVEEYPKFLPWCSHARIISANEQEIIAELVINFKGFSDKYTSRIRHRAGHAELGASPETLKQVQGDGLQAHETPKPVQHDAQDNKFIIEIEAISGPFKQLTSTWEFNEIEKKSCNVSFFISFEFKNLLLNKLIGVFFAKATAKMISAFEHRARHLNSAK